MNKRCHECNKKANLTFDCKCQKCFCVNHRLPEKHKCEKLFDIHRLEFKNNEKNLLNCSVKIEQFVKLE